MRRCALAVAALVLGAESGTAQTLPDTAGLVSTVGALLADSIVPAIGRRNRLDVLPPASAFDSAVATLLRTVPEASLPERPGYRSWIGTRGVAMRADTAVVLVEVGTSWPPRPDEAMTAYHDKHNLFFVRGPGGWRCVRREFVSHSDIGLVRG
ncbi:hypothetical protein [Longimicrobium sp.]|jgi:hypothetical protein|uniref:hypothetical protein n=1 Tax=Longimicrobium sp. TaxID=2029185 RepID=UPI002EDAB449